jgi:hypothetical protein
MVVSICSRVSSFSGGVTSASADSVENVAKEFSGVSTLSIQSKAGFFQVGEVGDILLLVLVCCLMLATVGCGAGFAMPVDGLHASPTAVNFGDVPVNQQVDGSILFSNNSSVSLTISKMSVTDRAFSIQERSDLPISIPAGGNRLLKVGFIPTAVADYSGQLAVMDQFAAPMAQIPLRGHGSSPGSAQLTLNDTALSFGSVAVNSATTRSLILKSTGSSRLTVNSAAVSGPGFSLVGGGLPITLDPNQSTTLQVQFKPTAAGPASGQLALNTNAANGSTTAVVLSGSGAEAPSPQLSVSTSSLAFGNVDVNTAKAMALTLTSTGNSALTVNSAAITGAGFTIVGGTLPVTLNPQQSMTLQVQFKPIATGPAIGKINISSNATNGSSFIVKLNGTGAAAANPQLTVNATSLAFGNVTVNTAKALSLVLTSTGTSAVTVNSAAITGAGFTIVGGMLPATLSPQQSMTLQVQFKPTATGAASGQITINSNSTSGGTTAIALSGTGAAATSPQLTVSATTLAYGNVTVNTAKALSLVLTSIGTSAVTVNSAAITGAGFSIVSGTLPATLSPQQSITLQVQFKPTATGAASGQITISSNSTNGSTTVVALSGTGAAATSPQLTVSTTSLAFGNVTVNTAKALSLVLSSTGTSAVTVNSAAIAGAGFTIIGGTLPATLNPQQSITLQVQFKPTAMGAASGQISISSNSSNGGSTIVALSGTGAAAVNPQLTVSTTSLAFGNVTVNMAKALSLVLTSTGTSAITVNSATITGAGYTIVSQTFPATLNPQQSMTLQVQFKPTATGVASGQITISSNSTSGSTAIVALSGTGAAANPLLTVSTNSLSFGSIAINTAITLNATLKSTGTTPVTVNSAAITGAGFSIIGGSFPITLDPSGTATVQVQFKPTTVGAATGKLTISSNSGSGNTVAVNLSGTGTATTHQVNLSWTAPSNSPDPVKGYNIYRSTGGGAMTLMNVSPEVTTSYVDSTVTNGTSYSYVVKSVDSSGVESVGSNQIEVTIP